jgi:hypothetical protein
MLNQMESAINEVQAALTVVTNDLRCLRGLGVKEFNEIVN